MGMEKCIGQMVYIQIYNKGSYYKGLWERGIRNGEGELYVPGSNIQKGLFNNNIFV